jgi:hypothetical protein
LSVSTQSILSWPHGIPLVTRGFRLRPFNIASIAAQTQEMIPGGLVVQRFEAKLAMSELEEEQWRDVDGLLADLAGTGGLIRLWDHARQEPYYNQEVARTEANWDGGGTFVDGGGFISGPLPPFVTLAYGASRGDTFVTLKGFPASTERVLRRGDLMELRPYGIPAPYAHLYEVTRTARSNAAGWAGVHFKPGLRRGARGGDMMVIGSERSEWKPSSVFRLTSDDEGAFEVSGTMMGAAGVSLTEVLPRT